jgi:hypothetical protein
VNIKVQKTDLFIFHLHFVCHFNASHYGLLKWIMVWL